MKLKPDMNYNDFFKCAAGCKGDVYYNTNEGDHINLKSVLSMYIFTTLSIQSGYQMDGELVCEDSADYERFSKYLADTAH